MGPPAAPSAGTSRTAAKHEVPFDSGMIDNPEGLRGAPRCLSLAEKSVVHLSGLHPWQKWKSMVF